MFELVVLASYFAGTAVLSMLALGLSTELFASKPGGIAKAEIFTLSLATVISVPFSFFILTDAPIWEFALVGLLSAFPIVYLVSRIRNKAAESAPALVEFALANFDKLDRNGDGEYTRADILDCIESGKFNEGDMKMLKRLMNSTESIGHVYDWMLVASHPTPGYPIALYAVNRKDLSMYVQRTSQYSGGLFA